MGAGPTAVFVIVGAQLGVTLAGTGISAWLGGGHAAWSAAVGGAISVVTTSYFAWRALGVHFGRPARQLVSAFYLAEMQKLVLTAILFFVAIRWLNVSFLPLLATFSAALLVYWLTLPLTITDFPARRS
jgi:ATP synthase protein I